MRDFEEMKMPAALPRTGVALMFLLPLLAIAATPASDSALAEALAAYRRNDFAGALRLWRPLAGAGNPDAQFNLFILYANGRGTAQDTQEATRWLRLAARQGLPAAQEEMKKHGLSW